MPHPTIESHRFTAKNTDRSRLNIDTDGQFYEHPPIHHTSRPLDSDERYSRFKYHPNSVTSNGLITEPRRDASYNSLLDVKETERRDGTDRGIDHTSSIQPYERRSSHGSRLRAPFRPRSHRRDYSDDMSQHSYSPKYRVGAHYRPVQSRNATITKEDSFERERKLYESRSESQSHSRSRSITPNAHYRSRSPADFGLQVQKEPTRDVKVDKISIDCGAQTDLNYSFEPIEHVKVENTATNKTVNTHTHSLVPYMHNYLENEVIKYANDQDSQNR